ncbi:hypothetical protein NP493_466g03005 [Ridgeia piscesae]|uniref:Uncharacterized protein n=1 Tax=Ridgeia piscesae TaxID=27915 RepID=A0AAD9KYC4_RIDPI|nr:hypothetical protein NP493_466g03005 [Ridgeia piscesae]
MLKLQHLITHRTMVMLYKANNHCLEGRVQAFFFNQLQPYTSMIPDNLNYFMLKQRIPPIDYCQLLSEVYTYGTV